MCKTEEKGEVKGGQTITKREVGTAPANAGKKLHPQKGAKVKQTRIGHGVRARACGVQGSCVREETRQLERGAV